jgi:RNase P/RNase MRP subunit p30
MAIDFVSPNNNEKELVQIAESLGYSSLCFCYPYSKNFLFPKLTSIKLKLFTAFIFNEKNISKINSSKANLNILQNNSNLRNIIETHRNKIDYALDIETSSRSDFLHHRNSGLNQIICTLLKENKIRPLLSFNNLLNTSTKNLPIYIGRIKQNIKLARKYKLNSQLASFATQKYDMRPKHDLIALLIILGMHPKEAKDALKL